MIQRRALWRTLVLVVLFVAASGSMGCQTLGKMGRATGRYFKYRGEDFAETFDIGISLSRKPCMSLYACFASVICLGYSNFQGHMFGMGGGQLGWIGLSNKCYGRMYAGAEQVTWSKGTRWRLYTHPMGLDAVLGAQMCPPPAYFPACTHYLHFLFIGVVANLKYAEVLDFILGFTTFDLACDDGQTLGRWFFQ